VSVIYMTGNEDPAVRKAALASGCIAFLIKPLIGPLQRAGRHALGTRSNAPASLPRTLKGLVCHPVSAGLHYLNNATAVRTTVKAQANHRRNEPTILHHAVEDSQLKR
jgi:hypothetical protein